LRGCASYRGLCNGACGGSYVSELFRGFFWFCPYLVVVKIFAETERLILRELGPADAPAMFEMDSDPLVHRFLGGHVQRSVAESEAVIESVRAQYLRWGMGRWAVVVKASGAFAGWAGLKREAGPVNGREGYTDLGYRLLRSFWGNGYAREASLAALRWGFEEKGLAEVCAAADLRNTASSRILQGLHFSRKNCFAYDGAMHYWYALSLEQWKANHR